MNEATWSAGTWERIGLRAAELYRSAPRRHPDGEPMDVAYPGDPDPECVRQDAAMAQAIREENDRRSAPTSTESEWRADVQRGIS